jgi:FkbM family methyltransferase
MNHHPHQSSTMTIPPGNANDFSVRTPSPDGFRAHLETVCLSGAEQFFLGRELKQHGLGWYEPEVFAALHSYIESIDGPVTFVDIGANIGIFSLMSKATFGDKILVHCVEPLPALAGLCRHLALRNRLSIDVGEYAIAEADGRAELYVSAAADTSNSLNPAFRKHKDVIEVATARLDSLFRGASGPFILKIDTESTEPSVLAGGAEFLRTVRPVVICEVLAKRSERRLGEIFGQLDYRPIHLREDPDWRGEAAIVGDATYRYRDWLFAPESPSTAVRSRFAGWLRAYRAEKAPGPE